MTFSPERDHFDRGVGVEDGLADRRARRGVHALGDLLGVGALVEAREHQLGELVAGDPVQRLVHVDQALVDELGGDPEGRARGALADPGLQHPQLVALDGELDVAQVAVVVLQRLHDLEQLVVRRLVDALEVLQRQRVADAGDDVLALRVLQVVAVDALLAGARVAGEGDAGAGVHAEVAEHHRADVDRGAEVGRDALLAAVEDRARGVPRVEDRADREVHLLARVGRELAAGLVADDALERVDDAAQVVLVEVEVVRGAAGLLRRVDGVLEVLAVDAEHGLAEHLDQPAVGVPGEPLAAGLLGQPLHRLVVEPDVEDRLHHAGHRELRAGAHRDQQRVVGLAEPLAHRLLQGREVRADLVAQLGRLVAAVEVDLARLGGDVKPGGTGSPRLVISARLAPLPPSRSFRSLLPSVKS